MAIGLTTLPDASPIPCDSEIVRVAVHGRGALVTRRITPRDELPEGDALLLIEGITPQAKANSARASLRGVRRRLVALKSEWHIPSTEQPAGPSVERVRELDDELRRARALLDLLERRRQALATLDLTPARDKTWRERGPGARVEHALALTRLIEERIEHLDVRRHELVERREQLARARQGAQLEDAQRPDAERAGGGRPSWRFAMHLDGQGPAEGLELSYVVDAARWWPMYTLRLSDGGRQAELMLEAVVTQRTGEDWGAVELALSTADLLQDARLPELPSLKLGKRQRPRSRGYRPPPPGLDRLFGSYDQARRRLEPATPSLSALVLCA